MFDILEGDIQKRFSIPVMKINGGFSPNFE
jgi:hypothetical protein